MKEASLDCNYRDHVWKQRQQRLDLEKEQVKVEHHSTGSTPELATGLGMVGPEFRKHTFLTFVTFLAPRPLPQS